MRRSAIRWAITGTLLGVLRSNPAAAQGTFEGMVTYKISTPDGKTAVIRYYQLGSRVRQEVQVEGQTASTITDGTTGEMTTIIPQRKQYMVMNLKQAAGALAPMAGAMGKRQAPVDYSKFKVTATGRRETIVGVSCEHYLFENTEQRSRGQTDICAAGGMGFMGSPYQAGALMPSTAAMLRANNPELARLMRRGFFPLKMTMTEGGKQSVFEATAVDRHRPDAALFTPPPGYSRLEIPGMTRKP